MIRDKETGIIYNQWRSPHPRAVFLLVHGLGAHTGRWGFFSDFFLKDHFSSYALELKGFGETKDLKGHIDSFNTYFNDIRSLYEIITKENEGKKVFLVGESVGALISFLSVIKEPHLYGGLICLSPAFASRLKTTPMGYITKLLPLLYNPKKQFNIPFDSRMCTRDADYQKAMDRDTREHRLATSRLIFETLAAQARCGILKGRLKTAVLFLLAGDDKMVDTRASRKVFDGLREKDKTILQYPKMYHSLSIDLGRERVFNDILTWVKKRI